MPFLLGWIELPARAAGPGPVTFEVEGARIVARDTSGAALELEDLIGTTFRLGDAATGVYMLRVDDALPDDGNPALDLYEVSVRTPGSDRFEPLCAADPEGRTTAVAVPGFWNEDGTFVRGAPGQFEFACTAGAQGKCVRFGYPPWASAPNGASLAPYHAACVRMVRADYCGDGTPHTVPGVTIEMFDSAGIHSAPRPRLRRLRDAVGTGRGRVPRARPPPGVSARGDPACVPPPGRHGAGRLHRGRDRQPAWRPARQPFLGQGATARAPRH